MTLFLMGLSLLAGWLVNLAADHLPARRTVRQPGAEARQLLIWQQGQRRGRRYLVVWALALFLGWLASFCTGGQAASLPLAGLAWFFLAVAVIDLEHRLVLNCMLLPAPLILLGQWFAGSPQFVSAVLGGVAGFGCFLLLALLRPGSLGMGDVKLAGVIGLAVGIADLDTALLVGVCVGALASLLVLIHMVLIHSRFRPGQSIAYAPCLVFGAWTALYAHADFLHLVWRTVP